MLSYWPGTPSGQPSAQVEASAGSWIEWEGSSKSQAFPDGDVFSWYIPALTPYYTYAGTADNEYSSFWCYSGLQMWDYAPYTGNQDWCTSVYDCSHQQPISNVPGDETNFYYNLDSNWVTLPDDFTDSVQSIMHNVYSKFDGTSGQGVDAGVVDLGDGMSISFSGNGNIPGNTLTALANILNQVIAPLPAMDVQFTTSETVCTSYCGTSQGPVCCATEVQTTSHRKIPSTVEVYAENTATNSDQGQLTYTLTYTPPAVDCGALGIFKDALSIASLFGAGDIETLVGRVATGTGIIGTLSGC